MQDWLTAVQNLRAKSSRLVAGVMSGTSVDSVDVALCQIQGRGFSSKITLQSLYTHPYPAALQVRVRAAKNTTIREVSELHHEIGELFADAVLAACKKAGVNSVDLIGSHGQTVYHHSGQKNALRCTLQIGDGDVIAERTGALTVSDFRARDVAAGGEGAPLTPYADVILFKATDESRAVLNLGGIANLTFLSPKPERVLGFDSGPANAPLDRIYRKLATGTHDQDGALARSGKVNQKVLADFIAADGYLSRPPPKSTGFEQYGDDWVERFVAAHGALSADCLATAVEFVAKSIVAALAHAPGRTVKELIVAGGGGKNKFLIERVQKLAPTVNCKDSGAEGVPAEAREAMAFALFAHEALFSQSSNLPSVTGARAPRVLGKLSFLA